MAAPRRGILIGTAVCLATLSLCEYAVITVLILPLPSTAVDWKLATVCIAPSTAAFILWLAVFTARIISDVFALIRRIGQWIKKAPSHHHHPADLTPSPSTPSAARPSSSYGWPSDGSSSTSHPGKRGAPWL